MAECHPCRGIYKQITTAGINFSLGAIIWDNFRFSPGSDHCHGGRKCALVIAVSALRFKAAGTFANNAWGHASVSMVILVAEKVMH